MNREYEIALQFVQRKYNLLHHYATAIVLTPAKYFPGAQLGQCSPDNYVSIADTPRTVGDYINTLVHELTHCQQNIVGKPVTDKAREEQAYAAGILAATEYMREAAPWLVQRG